MRFVAVIVLTVLLVGQSAFCEEVPVEDIRKAIADAVDKIIKTQRDDGGFSLSNAKRLKEYPVGNTALAVMALEYARPHVAGERRTHTFAAIRKGVSYIAQQPPETKTYSAGLTICALFMENPQRYRRIIGTYATMLVISQHDREYASGEWGYDLRPYRKIFAGASGGLKPWADKSNTQFALLGLYHASRAGFQVPRVVWERSARHYVRAQFDDGGWGYMPTRRPKPYANMTIASTISLNLCEEMMRSKRHWQCKPPPRIKPIENGLKWIGDNWERKKIGSDTYGLYALERLGIIMGRANIGEHDWYNEGARKLLSNPTWSSFASSSEVSTAFGLMFLARGLEPIVINKLQRRDTNDWNNDPYDVKHLVEYIRDHYQQLVQWRIVTLEAPLELLTRTPMLYISGHDELDFNEQEKEKLKAYVANGGTIIGQACCGKKPFHRSFHKLVDELFGSKLTTLPHTHDIYQRMRTRGLAPKPVIKIATLQNGQGPPAVIYLPHDHSCRWHTGGKRAREAFAVGTGIYCYVTLQGKNMIRASQPETPTHTTPRENVDEFGEAFED